MQVPFHVELPDGWHLIEPDDGAAFAAISERRDEGFSPTIVIAFTELSGEPDFTALADASRQRLANAVERVEVLDRRPIDGGGVAQTLAVHISAAEPGEAGLDLIQSQVQLAIPLDVATQQSLGVEFSCTSTRDQVAEAAPEFSEFVASFRIRETV